jgi:Co/Zn/Cd efflux system component
MWAFLFGFLSALHAIIEEMLIISFVGLVANVVGWGLFKIAGNEKNSEFE